MKIITLKQYQKALHIVNLYRAQQNPKSVINRDTRIDEVFRDMRSTLEESSSVSRMVNCIRAFDVETAGDLVDYMNSFSGDTYKRGHVRGSGPKTFELLKKYLKMRNLIE